MSEASEESLRPEALLIQLHEAVTETLLQRVRSGEATAAEITAAIKHLQANGIDSGTGKAQGPLLSLAAELPFADPKVSVAREG